MDTSYFGFLFPVFLPNMSIELGSRSRELDRRTRESFGPDVGGVFDLLWLSNFRMMVSKKVFGGAIWPLLTGIVTTSSLSEAEMSKVVS